MNPHVADPPPGHEAHSADVTASLAPTTRVAPVRTETPQAPRRRWRPRPRVTEIVAGLAGFSTMVVLLCAPVAMLAGGGFPLALATALVGPPILVGVGGLAVRTFLVGTSPHQLVQGLWAVAGTGIALSVGLAVGGLAWVVGPGAHASDVGVVMQPVLVTCAYSLTLAITAATAALQFGAPRARMVTAA